MTRSDTPVFRGPASQVPAATIHQMFSQIRENSKTIILPGDDWDRHWYQRTRTLDRERERRLSGCCAQEANLDKQRGKGTEMVAACC